MRAAGRGSQAERRVAALLAAHGSALRRVARRWSLCEEDAEDAFQRSLEIYVRRLDTVERATEAAWLKVVIRNEALAIRHARGESVGREDVDLDTRVAADLRALEDRLASRERSARSAEALRELKPDEALALLMKAEGHSYQEIAESQGWTYTNVCGSGSTTRKVPWICSRPSAFVPMRTSVSSRRRTAARLDGSAR